MRTAKEVKGGKEGMANLRGTEGDGAAAGRPYQPFHFCHFNGLSRNPVISLSLINCLLTVVHEMF